MSTRRRFSSTAVHRLRYEDTAGWVERNTQGPPVCAATGAGEDDPEGGRQSPLAGHSDDRRPGRANFLEAGARAYLQGGLQACSYDFRPKRRAKDAIAEIHYLASPTRNYHWVFEADIKACFDEIDHAGLMKRMRHRIANKRILSLVKAFLKAGVLSEDGTSRETITGTPQGGILSPLLANIALSVLDEHFTRRWDSLGPSCIRSKRRRAGEPVMRLVCYAEDFAVTDIPVRRSFPLGDRAVNAGSCRSGTRAVGREHAVAHHSDRGAQYVSIRYTERPAESVIGLYKTEVIRQGGP